MFVREWTYCTWIDVRTSKEGCATTWFSTKHKCFSIVRIYMCTGGRRYYVYMYDPRVHYVVFSVIFSQVASEIVNDMVAIATIRRECPPGQILCLGLFARGRHEVLTL